MKKKTTGKKVGELVLIKRQKNISAYTLPQNGLTVLRVHMPKSETVTTTIVYTVGSRHEQTGETGLAHMLEHMLFKPTSGTGVKWKDLENKGAHLNATTWLDRTLYYFTLPKAYFGDMLHVEADRMRNTLLTPKEFLPERMNVLSEYEMYNSRPEMALEWHMTATAFQYHGYHHDTIGFKSDIEGYTIEKLRSFYDRYYWPKNATLIVVGDIEETAFAKMVNDAFGSLTNGGVIAPDTRVEEKQEGVRRVSLARTTPLRVLNYAWKAPAFSSPDWVPLMLGLNYLTQGETSPLYRALIDAKLGTEVSAHLFPTHDPYLAYVSVAVRENVPYTTIESTIDSVLKTVLKKPIPVKKLSLLKESLIAEDLFSRDGTGAIALSLAEYVATGSWERFLTSTDEIQKVTSENITRALNTYLIKSAATIGTLDTP